MTLADGEEASPALRPEAAEEMAKYGITCVPVDYFHYGSFRYTNLEDAVAEAKRQQPPKDSGPAVSPEITEELAKVWHHSCPSRLFLLWEVSLHQLGRRGRRSQAGSKVGLSKP
jgi:hypothetical protein